MGIGRLWAGRAYGTNTGNLFVKFEGGDEALSGTLRLNEPGYGVVIYSISAQFDGTHLRLEGNPQTEIQDVSFGRLYATATLGSRGVLEGEWQTDTGSAGTFELFPHDKPPIIDQGEATPQLHSARHDFGAVKIDRNEIIAVAEKIQKDFKSGSVIVTINSGTEQSRYLHDFKAQPASATKARVVKIYGQELEQNGINKTVTIEFGHQINWAMTQSSSESWALGKLETLKRDLKRFEKSYVTNFKKIGINQLLFIWTIIYLPSLDNLEERALFVGASIALLIGVNWLHEKYLPHAAIHLSEKPAGILNRIGPSVISWVIAATAGLFVAVLSAYFQGWLVHQVAP